MSESDKPKRAGPIPVGELVQRLVSRNAAGEPAVLRPKEKPPFPPVVPKYGVVRIGRFERHGPGSPPEDLGRISYFVEILTTDGPELLWGSDLKRAIQESETNPKLGFPIGVQRVGYQLLKVPGLREPLQRTRWRVERVEYFAEHALQARKDREEIFRGRDSRPRVAPPQSRAIDLDQIQAYANRHIHHAHDREQFIKDVTDHLRRSASNSPPQPTRAKDYDPPTR